ncbi:hypothetical protein A6R68_21850, partial [Neotoma lepida]
MLVGTFAKSYTEKVFNGQGTLTYASTGTVPRSWPSSCEHPHPAVAQ